MIKILLACMGGMSTSILARNMVKAAQEKGYTAELAGIMSERDYAESQLKEADIVVCYTSVMALNRENLRKSRGDEFDVFMIGPQSRFWMTEIENLRAELKLPKIPHCIIENEHFGRGNGEAVLNIALEMANDN